MPEYDYLIVGAGLYGAVFAHELTAQGYRCLVIDRRGHIGGNVYTEMVADVCVHRYGAHISTRPTRMSGHTSIASRA